MYFSIIIPVYNRPDEINALLESLTRQTNQNFEVILVEDGSSVTCKEVVQGFTGALTIKYLQQENTGQGFARNHGMKVAQGDYFLFFDSDCTLPEIYLEKLHHAILVQRLDAHGGPDDAGEEFSPWQKAMNFSMTSFLTTGGIRGKLKDKSKYQARGFNMGFSRRVFEKIGGFVHPNMAEDIEISLRIKKEGFKLELVEEAFVFHRRKNTLSSFIRQGFKFGRNRVFIRRYHSDAVKWVHLLPLGFILGIPLVLAFYFWWPLLSFFLALGYGLWLLLVFLMASLKYRSFSVGLLAILTSTGQLCGYGAGLLFESLRLVHQRNTTN
ncbi:MAG: glycosyltransferase [Cyclobacteriaceae bacterium]